MNIDIKDVLTLSDDHKYVVVSKTIVDGITYYYIVDTANVENLKFCAEDGNELVEIEDQTLIQKLLPLFANEIKEDIASIIMEQE